MQIPRKGATRRVRSRESVPSAENKSYIKEIQSTKDIESMHLEVQKHDMRSVHPGKTLPFALTQLQQVVRAQLPLLPPALVRLHYY